MQNSDTMIYLGMLMQIFSWEETNTEECNGILCKANRLKFILNCIVVIPICLDGLYMPSVHWVMIIKCQPMIKWSVTLLSFSGLNSMIIRLKKFELTMFL